MAVKRTIDEHCTRCGMAQITRYDRDMVWFKPCNCAGVPGPPPPPVHYRLAEVNVNWTGGTPEMLSDPQRPDWATRKPNVADVFKAGQNDPIVKTVIDTWQRGGFGSWEDAMTALAVYLAEQNRELREKLHRAVALQAKF